MNKVLTIAGSDSGGGAGLQADLKTFEALGVYGGSVVTAVTAQNTRGVHAVYAVPHDVVAAQLDAVLEDIAWDAVKTGMLANAGVVQVVAGRLERRPDLPVVVDPVLISKSGHALLEPEAMDALKTRLFRLALVVTPNAPEAEALSGVAVRDLQGARDAAVALHRYGARYVVVKGGHLGGPECVDTVFDGERFETVRGPRHPTRHLHGTGCTFASAVAAGIARGLTVVQAVRLARAVVDAAVQAADTLGVGHGVGPLDHKAAARSSAVRAILDCETPRDANDARG